MDGAKLALVALVKRRPTANGVFVAAMVCLAAIAKNHPSDIVQICAIGAVVILVVAFVYLVLAGKTGKS